MQFSDLATLNQTQFTDLLAEIYEHSPWVAAKSWALGPFQSLADLHQAMANTLLQASKEQQLELILAHPELASKAAVAGAMAEASKKEQKGAGLDQCSPTELAQIRSLNQSYRDKFSFPFIIAVSGMNRSQIIAAMQTRLANDPATEFNTALAQINQIALIRLQQLFS